LPTATELGSKPATTEPAANPQVETKPEQSDLSQYVLTVFYSEKPLDEIRDTVNSFDPDGEPDTNGIIRGDAVRTVRLDLQRSKAETGYTDYTETNRCIATVKRGAFEALFELFNKRTQYDLRVSEYQIREGNHPPKDCTYALFIPIPKECDLNVPANFASISAQMTKKIKACTDVGFLQGRWIYDEHLKSEICVGANFKVHYPTTSRSGSGVYANNIVVTFSGDVSRDDCARVKVMLDMTFWTGLQRNSQGQHEVYYCHVAWCRQSALRSLTSAGRSRPHTAHVVPQASGGKVYSTSKSSGVKRPVTVPSRSTR
jgi:hypothetical protein